MDKWAKLVLPQKSSTKIERQKPILSLRDEHENIGR